MAMRISHVKPVMSAGTVAFRSVSRYSLGQSMYIASMPKGCFSTAIQKEKVDSSKRFPYRGLFSIGIATAAITGVGYASKRAFNNNSSTASKEKGYVKSGSVIHHNPKLHTSKASLPMQIPEFMLQRPKKDWFYAQDPFFRVRFQTFEDSIEELEPFFHNYTYLLIKPDGLVAHAFDKVVSSLEEEGFQIVSFEPFKYTRTATKLFWFYESNLFPNEWFQLFDMVLCDKPSVIFLLKDTRANNHSQSATKRLLALKGSTEASKRTENQIRSKIEAGSGLFCYIHSPDDPLSMIRELGIVLEDSACKRLLANGLKVQNPIQAEAFVSLRDSLYKEIGSHSLDYKTACKRLKTVAASLEAPLRTRMEVLIDDPKGSWQELLKIVKEHNIQVSEWDLITFCGNRSARILPIKPIIQD